MIDEKENNVYYTYFKIVVSLLGVTKEIIQSAHFVF